MSTTYLSPEADDYAARQFRYLSIAADLLPLEIAAARRVRATRRAVLSALGGFAVVLLGWSTVAVYGVSSARNDLDEARSNMQRLSAQQRQYHDLMSAQAESQAVKAQLAAAFGSDLRWPRLLDSLRLAAPAGVQVTGITGGRATTADAHKHAEVNLPKTSTENVVGDLTITGTAPNLAAVGAFMDAADNTPGVGTPQLTSITEQRGSVRFTIRVDITRAAVGGRYTEWTDGEKGD